MSRNEYPVYPGDKNAEMHKPTEQEEQEELRRILGDLEDTQEEKLRKNLLSNPKTQRKNLEATKDSLTDSIHEKLDYE